MNKNYTREQILAEIQNLEGSYKIKYLIELLELDSDVYEKLDKSLEAGNVLEMHRLLLEITCKSLLPTKRIELISKCVIGAMQSILLEAKEKRIEDLENADNVG